jgi:predicted Fe-Mo cluster-binding NifX family protein
MLIAVSAETDADLDAPVAGHFGHAPYFILVEVTAENRQIGAARSIANPHYPNHEPGAVPAFIHSQGVQVMLTGGMGARATGFFQQYGIQPVTGAKGTVRQAVDAFMQGQVTGSMPCHESTHGCGDAHDQGRGEQTASGM